MIKTVTYCIDSVHYTKYGWYGCQLFSIEQYWFHTPYVGDMRRIAGFDMSIDSVKRIGRFRKPTYQIYWNVSPLGTLDERHERITALYKKLDD